MFRAVHAHKLMVGHTGTDVPHGDGMGGRQAGVGYERARPTRGNPRLQVLTNDGDFITSFGDEGSGDGQFRNPIGIDLDASGHVYVTDLSNNRVRKFRPAVSRRRERVVRQPARQA